MPQELTAPPTFDSMSPGEKLEWLLGRALDCKREILILPLPDPSDDSAEAHRLRSLILAAADSTIEQTIRLQTNQLKPAAGNDDIEQIIEERRKKAVLEIERMDEDRDPHSRGLRGGPAGFPDCPFCHIC
jgi:hypothetical protein